MFGGEREEQTLLKHVLCRYIKSSGTNTKVVKCLVERATNKYTSGHGHRKLFKHKT